MLVYKENEALKQENRMLRDKATILDEEINRMNANRAFEADYRALQEEVDTDFKTLEIQKTNKN